MLRIRKLLSLRNIKDSYIVLILWVNGQWSKNPNNTATVGSLSRANNP